MRLESEVRSPEDRIHQDPASSLSQTQSSFNWRDVLAKFALFFFSIALWSKGLSFYAYYLLSIAWILDGDLKRTRQTFKEPLVAALLVLCILLALGILWSDDPKSGFKTWRRYFAFLIFIPYLSLLNKERLSWAIAGLLIGYCGALAIGVYQRIIVGAQGIAPLDLLYVHFSSVLGIGVITALYLACVSKNRIVRPSLWLLTILLLSIQFSQNARGILIATLISSAFMVFSLHKKNIKMFFNIMAFSIILVGFFAYNNPIFHERVTQAERDIELFKQGKYDTSLGYRFAIWDIGLHGISERPLLGHGTGMAASYFDKTAETYKGGRYKGLREFHSTTYHYHNDWIELGMHVGTLGLMAYLFLLWSWFRTLKRNNLASFGLALVGFIILSGLTDVLVFFRQTVYLLLIVTAISVAWKRSNNVEKLNCRTSSETREKTNY